MKTNAPPTNFDPTKLARIVKVEAVNLVVRAPLSGRAECRRPARLRSFLETVRFWSLTRATG
jgi:hypothetical protein